MIPTNFRLGGSTLLLLQFFNIRRKQIHSDISRSHLVIWDSIKCLGPGRRWGQRAFKFCYNYLLASFSFVAWSKPSYAYARYELIPRRALIWLVQVWWAYNVQLSQHIAMNTAANCDNKDQRQSTTSFIDLHPTSPPPLKSTKPSNQEDVVCEVCVLRGCRRNSLTGSLSSCKETPDSRGGPHVQNCDNWHRWLLITWQWLVQWSVVSPPPANSGAHSHTMPCSTVVLWKYQVFWEIHVVISHDGRSHCSARIFWSCTIKRWVCEWRCVKV